ncbi:MAG: hypothetical protein JRF72_16390 [Deltaproteobacteria bacterium]|jgi:hypothetical protein|nr:hypothetical protein [Deltaproteobacteria bacterium]
MNALENIDKKDLRDLLGKGWLTHDGMWFYNTYQALGIEQANTLNKAAIRSIAPIEINRVKKILGLGEEKIQSFEILRDFMDKAFQLILPESVFGRFHFDASRKNTFHWEWEKGQCFAFKGMTQLGAIDEYRCGVMYRIECWLEALGINFSIDPPIDKCIMHTTGVCSGDIRVS